MNRCHYCGCARRPLIEEPLRGVALVACDSIDDCVADPAHSVPLFESTDAEQRLREQHASDLLTLGDLTVSL